MNLIWDIFSNTLACGHVYGVIFLISDACGSTQSSVGGITPGQLVPSCMRKPAKNWWGWRMTVFERIHCFCQKVHMVFTTTCSSSSKVFSAFLWPPQLPGMHISTYVGTGKMHKFSVNVFFFSLKKASWTNHGKQGSKLVRRIPLWLLLQVSLQVHALASHQQLTIIDYNPSKSL